MPDNLSPAMTPRFALPDHALIVLQGPDAAAFAQAQFANDVAALAPGHWQWNAWLTPKGRVIAVFALLKLAQDHLLLVAADNATSELASQLQGLVFRRKLKVVADTDHQVAGCFLPPASARNAQIGASPDQWELDYGSTHTPRSLLIVAADADLPTDTDACARWRLEDLKYGLPRLATEHSQQWTPQQLSLERLPAFSVKKGCYPGQEIVARTHFLGKAKRGLALFQANAALAPGTPVEAAEGQSLGQVICSQTCAGITWLLAVLPLEHDVTPCHAAGISLLAMPLLHGLQR